jgi:lipid A disaccharide synthetase
MLPAALYLGYIDPVYSGTPGLIWIPESSIFALQAQKVQYENSIAQVDLIESELSKISKEYIDLNKDVKNKVEIILPDNIEQFKLRNEVTSIANKSGLAVSGVKIVEILVNKYPTIGCYRVSFVVKGNYTSIKNLIDGFEKSLRFFIVKEIGISRFIKKDESGNIVSNDNDDTLESTISFDVYYLKS